jgi:hypothetical protein
MNKDEDAGKLGKIVYGSINSWIIYRRMVSLELNKQFCLNSTNQKSTKN